LNRWLDGWSVLEVCMGTFLTIRVVLPEWQSCFAHVGFS
jgi:hypothetical protein